MGKKVLIILTSTDKMANGKPTGWYLPELAHPFKILHDAGVAMDLASPKGGVAPLDPSSVEAFKEDEGCKWFQAFDADKKLVAKTKKLSDVKSSLYDAVLFPGGHGPMFDLAGNEEVAKVTREIYEKGGIVAAVCHGPAALVHIKLSNGDYLVKDKKVTCFTNSEEAAVNMVEAMPFALESELVRDGCRFQCEPDWQECVMVDDRLITGQNPASSAKLGQELLRHLQK